jgi:hypothetical protein
MDGRGRGSLKGQYQEKDDFDAYYSVTIFLRRNSSGLCMRSSKVIFLIAFKETINNSGNGY